jgi:hypothetical protein
MTPDALKAQLASWRNRFISTDEFKECVISCADAWAGDVGMWKDAERHVDRLEKRLEAATEGMVLAEALVMSHEGHIAGLERRLAAATNTMKDVALRIGDRTHGAMASECNEWRGILERAALAAGEEKPDGWILSDGHRAGHG